MNTPTDILPPDALPPQFPDPSPQAKFVRSLLARGLVPHEDWDALPEGDRRAVLTAPDRAAACDSLVSLGLLTPYQANRVRGGKWFGLVLGGYRVLDRLGAGGMGVVFRAENLLLRQPVAVKVVAAGEAADPRVLARFVTEARAVAGLRHPNIVAALDAGVARGRKAGRPDLYYFVMEYVPGQDLDAAVRGHGPMPVARACGLAYQLCGALAEAHRHGLVHRDIKPLNVIATPQGTAKLLDFGLVLRDSALRLTQSGTVLGTAAYMAPEQITDPRSVDARADLYSLGATLFWCLAGKEPFDPAGDAAGFLARRAVAGPPRLRDVCPELPEELAEVVARMMAGRPADRFQSAQEVMRALLPFLQSGGRPAGDETVITYGPPAPVPVRRALVVDDEPELRRYYQRVLRSAGFDCVDVADGAEAVDRLRREPFDLLVLDLDMPGMGGPEVLHLLREAPPEARPKVLVVSGWDDPDGLARLLAVGADDYLAKPAGVVPLTARAQALMRLKREEERAERLAGQLRDLARGRAAGAADPAGAALALARVAAAHARAPAGRPARIAAFCRSLAAAAARLPAFRDAIDEPFVAGLAAVAPLCDVGTVAVPDHVLFKPGPLDPEERAVLEAHTTAGAELIRDAAGAVLPPDLLRTAVEVARHHHERFDGTGFPDRLSGASIPLAARLAAVAIEYEALRSPTPARPALNHAAAVDVITRGSPGRFDPAVLEAFGACIGEWEQRFRGDS